MRTTIQIDDHLHDLARQYAVARGKTFAALVEEALREKLLSKHKPTTDKKQRVLLKTVDGYGVQAGVELDNNATLLDLMELCQKSCTG
jgi:hypothetical protein